MRRGRTSVYPYFTPGERRELMHEIIDEVRVFSDHIEVALYDGTAVEEAIQQVARKVRGPRGGGTGGGKGANGTAANGGTVHAVHAEVHAEAEGREPVAGSMKARAATVKLAQRVEWLPVTDGRQNLGKKDRPRFWLTVRHPFIDPSNKRLKRKGGPARPAPKATPSRPTRKQELEAMMASGDFATRADLARHLCVSRAYVTQVLGPTVHAVHAERQDAPDEGAAVAAGGGA